MNEPSVFKQRDLTLPRTAKFNYFNETYSHREAHNLYGFFMHKASFDALKEKYKKRPFVLTRSFYLGSHKFGAVWTGDTSSKWEDMKLSVPMVLSNALAGFSFVGGDVGGFYSEGETDLFARWYQLGVFYPFFRAHSHNETFRREPWLFDDKTFRVIRDAIRLRYMLMPYVYLSFYQYYQSGMPVIRPMFFKYRSEEAKSKNNEQFFFGDYLLVRPVLDDMESYNNK
jgi:alpha 1,3-glucosidase